MWGAALVLLVFYVAPVLVSFCLPDPRGGVPWHQARRDPTGLSRPHILLDRRGPGVDAMIEQVRVAIANYPYPKTYRPWPGPNPVHSRRWFL